METSGNGLQGAVRPLSSHPPPAPRFANIRSDFERAYGYLTGSRTKRIAACFASPGIQALIVYRFGRWLRSQGLITRVVLEPTYFLCHLMIKCLWGIDIPRACQIGAGLYIGHFGGITLSPATMMGVNCNLSQDVTIGLGGKGERTGVPTIGDGVYIAPGAKLFGKIRIGNDVKIGANAVVYRDVPDHAVVVLAPGFKVISLKGNRQGSPADKQAP